MNEESGKRRETQAADQQAPGGHTAAERAATSQSAADPSAIGLTAIGQAEADQTSSEQEAQPSRDMAELHKTADMAIEILHRAHDGDVLAPSDLKLTEHAVNGFLTEHGLEVFADLHKRVIEGTYHKPWLNGVEPFTNDHEGYVYYEGIQVEHFNRDFMYTAAAKRALFELKGRCEYLESIGAEISCGSAILGWEKYAADYGRGKFEELRKFLAENVRASGGLPEDWGFDYARVSVSHKGYTHDYCTLDSPQSLDDVRRHEITRDLIGRGDGESEFNITVMPCHYGGVGVVRYQDIVSDTGAFEIYDADLLLESCHAYLAKQPGFEALPAVEYKTDFGEKQAAIDELNKLLDGYKTDGSGSLTYSLITVRDRCDILNVFCLLGEPDAAKLSRLHGVIGTLECLDAQEEGDVFVDVYRYGTGAELEIGDTAVREAIESSLDFCDEYLHDFDLTAFLSGHHYKADELQSFVRGPAAAIQTAANDGKPRLAYVASPLRADTPEETAANRERAADYCRALAEHYASIGEDITPVSPIVNLADLDDNDPAQRRRALNKGLALLEKCDTLIVAGGRVSEGMIGEIQAAARLGIPIKGYDVADELINDAIRAARPAMGGEVLLPELDDVKERLILINIGDIAIPYRTPENQLVYCTHGNGARKDAIGRSVFGYNVVTGEFEVWQREHIAGAVDAAKLPDWAREAWGAFQRGYGIAGEEADIEHYPGDEHDPAIEHNPSDKHGGDYDEESEYDEGSEMGDDD